MDLINATNMQAGYTMGMKPDGRELLVVAVKGTFSIPAPGKEPELLPEQIPLVEADVFTGKPGFSAVLYEVDYAPIKHRCDVILNGSAYAPKGRPAKKVTVGLRVGNLVKKFNVIGNRCWVVSGVSYSVSSPHTFVKLPISYDNAYGGMDDKHPDKNKHTAYMPNPVGKGFHTNLTKELLHGAPLPNTEEPGRPISLPAGNYRPMAFGPMGRQFDPRYKYGGTYDQNWLDNVFPFLPADFNEAYYQSAPQDQQAPFLQGGEIVELYNLTEDGHRGFRIPKLEVPVTFFKRNYERVQLPAQADTLVIEPDLDRFTITWRCHIPLRKNIFEITEILAGKKSKGWWRARDLGKIHYPNLDYAVRAKRLARQMEEAEEMEA